MIKPKYTTEAAQLRACVILALMIMMIAPQVDAAREQANITQCTEICIDILTKKDGALNEESQLIDPYDTKIADSKAEEQGGFSHSNTMHNIDKNLEYYINNRYDKEDPVEKLKQSIRDGDDYASAIGQKIELLNKTDINFHADSHDYHDIDSNLGSLFKYNAREYNARENNARENNAREPDNSKTTRIDGSGMVSNKDSKKNYIYENKDAFDHSLGIISPNVIPITNSKENYVYKSDETYIIRSDLIASSNVSSVIDVRTHEMHEHDDYNYKQDANWADAIDLSHSIDSNINYLNKNLQKTEIAYPDGVQSELGRESNTLRNINILLKEKSKKQMQEINYVDLETLPKSSKKGDEKKNFAIVIGIDEYKDRRPLRTSVNDANTMADLLRSHGYEVKVLTDETPCPPTKENILKVALAEMKQKRDEVGNALIYFSGHGYLDRDGNYYLIPKDANGATSSYISEEELNQYIKDIKNLAIIIDACNSGALLDVTAEGQLLLASSKMNEPSNEEWLGSLSVFTQNLCNAINKEAKKGSKIILQNCFYEAYKSTIQWSNGHLQSQTPILNDMTPNKRYYLNY